MERRRKRAGSVTPSNTLLLPGRGRSGWEGVSGLERLSLRANVKVEVRTGRDPRRPASSGGGPGRSALADGASASGDPVEASGEQLEDSAKSAERGVEEGRLEGDFAGDSVGLEEGGSLD